MLNKKDPVKGFNDEACYFYLCALDYRLALKRGDYLEATAIDKAVTDGLVMACPLCSAYHTTIPESEDIGSSSSRRKSPECTFTLGIRTEKRNSGSNQRWNWPGIIAYPEYNCGMLKRLL